MKHLYISESAGVSLIQRTCRPIMSSVDLVLSITRVTDASRTGSEAAICDIKETSVLPPLPYRTILACILQEEGPHNGVHSSDTHKRWSFTRWRVGSLLCPALHFARASWLVESCGEDQHIWWCHGRSKPVQGRSWDVAIFLFSFANLPPFFCPFYFIFLC